MATARLMETWAHGQDVADALASLACRPTESAESHTSASDTRFRYAVNEQTPPAEPFGVELTATLGEVWTWGPDDANSVSPDLHSTSAFSSLSAHNRDDLDVRADGADAAHWLTIAQAFAGPPGQGRDRQDARKHDRTYRQLLRFLRRSTVRDAGDARRRRPRLPHR